MNGVEVLESVGVGVEEFCFDAKVLAEDFADGVEGVFVSRVCVDFKTVTGREDEAFCKLVAMTKFLKEGRDALRAKGEALADFKGCFVMGATQHEEGLRVGVAHGCCWRSGVALSEPGWRAD